MMRHTAACSLVIGLSLSAAPAGGTVLAIGNDGTVTYGAPRLSSARRTPGVAAAAEPASTPAHLAAPLAAAADAAALASDLIAAVAWVESRFEAAARSPAGARGLMQLMNQSPGGSIGPQKSGRPAFRSAPLVVSSFSSKVVPKTLEHLPQAECRFFWLAAPTCVR